MRILHVQNHTGDTQYDLDTEKAKDVFVNAMLNGRMAFMSQDEEQTQVFDFEETADADAVVIPPQYAGG